LNELTGIVIDISQCVGMAGEGSPIGVSFLRIFSINQTGELTWNSAPLIQAPENGCTG